jgi:plastocyanin
LRAGRLAPSCRFVLLALAVAICGSGEVTGLAAAPATLRGRVDLQQAASPPAPRPGVQDLGSDVRYKPAERRRAVVYFESAPQPAFEDRTTLRATMSQEHETFVPHVLAVRVGTVVDFPNNDPTFHSVFSLSKTRRFDLGRYAAGRSKAVRFDDPGIVRVFCDIHSHMNAFILVFAHRFFAVTDDDGRYRIDRVPPGSYTVNAWYEGAVRQSQSVVIPEEGGTIDVDFTVR